MDSRKILGFSLALVLTLGFITSMNPITEKLSFTQGAEASEISTAVDGNLTTYVPLVIVIIFVVLIVGLIMGMARKFRRV